MCQIRTESLFYLVDSEFRPVVSVVVVNDNNLVVVENNLIYKVGYKVLTSAFVLDVEGGELLEPPKSLMPQSITVSKNLSKKFLEIVLEMGSRLCGSLGGS